MSHRRPSTPAGQASDDAWPARKSHRQSASTAHGADRPRTAQTKARRCRILSHAIIAVTLAHVVLSLATACIVAVHFNRRGTAPRGSPGNAIFFRHASPPVTIEMYIVDEAIRSGYPRRRGKRAHGGFVMREIELTVGQSV